MNAITRRRTRGVLDAEVVGEILAGIPGELDEFVPENRHQESREADHDPRPRYREVEIRQRDREHYQNRGQSQVEPVPAVRREREQVRRRPQREVCPEVRQWVRRCQVDVVGGERGERRRVAVFERQAAAALHRSREHRQQNRREDGAGEQICRVEAVAYLVDERSVVRKLLDESPDSVRRLQRKR
jgi:hypothetical protein